LNKGKNELSSGCCGNKNHHGMYLCWCPENYGCVEGQLTDEMIAELDEE